MFVQCRRVWLFGIAGGLVACVGCGRVGYETVDGDAAVAECPLVESGPVVASRSGEVIEGLRIRAVGEAGITVRGVSGVVIRGCEILHEGAPGIVFENADGLRIEDTRVIHTAPPESGPHASPVGNENILGGESDVVVLRRVHVARGSTGIQIWESSGVDLGDIEVRDVRGGRGVSFIVSDGAVLDGFSVENPLETSWPFAGVGVSNGADCQIRNGVIVGDSDPSGAGVLIHQPDRGTGALIEDVDVVSALNACFSAWSSTGVTLRRTRCRDMLCGDPGRGPASSGGLGWAGGSSTGGHAIEASEYFGLCRSEIVWPDEDFSPLEIREVDFAPRVRAPLDLCPVLAR